MPRVFLNYRREDSAGIAGRLFDRLCVELGREKVFRDQDTLVPGADFAKVIADQVASCDALIAVIGKDWLNARDADGHRRLDHPDDFVKAEIREALAREKLVIPTLVEGASLPKAADLPPDIAALAGRNAIEISDSRFAYDTERLIRAVQAHTDGHQDPRSHPTGFVPLRIGQTIDKLRIVSEMAQGGMGILYLAQHTALPKRFAVKSLSATLTEDPQFRARFYQEAQNQALLTHPNIVQAIDYIEDHGQFLFVMEYIDGQDLDTMIRDRGQLSVADALPIFKEILEGLDFAHRKGLIHRDMKPSNVLIDQCGHARITDFGIAILVGDLRRTREGVAIGTALYMSPEQIKRPRDLDRRSDIYSAGIVLYEMVTGDVPFTGDTDFSIKEQHVNSPPPNPCVRNPRISQRFGDLILKAIAKDPDQRYRDCREFLAAIRAYEEKAPWRPSKWQLLGAVAVACVLVVGAVFLFQSLYPPPVPRPDQEEAWRKADQAIQRAQEEARRNAEQTIQRAKEEASRRDAYQAIQQAVEKAVFVCREHAEAELRRKNLQSVKNINETALADKVAKQIEEKEENIREGIVQYDEAVARLVALAPAIVDEESDRYAKVSLDGKSFDKVRMAGVVQEQIQQYRKGGGTPPRSFSIDRCAKT
jgi:tRNA A-37 threonylcarbamoyl transferase component Bud32